MKQVTVRKKCPQCKDGEMKATGNAFSNSAGSYYDHKCDSCEHKDSLKNERYPHSYFEFEEHEKRTEWK